jgi:hypothetical protein
MLIGIIAGLGISGALAQTKTPNAAPIELQEKCGKRGIELFEKSYGSESIDADGGRVFYAQRTHFNSKQNKCIQLITITRPKSGMVQEELWDIYEMKGLGNFIVTDNTGKTVIGDIEGSVIKSKAEWSRFIEKIMAD